MRKITLILSVLLFATTIMAQRNAERVESFKNPAQMFVNDKSNDTLFPPSFAMACSDTLTLYSNPSFGYVSGNNSMGDKEKAQKYVNPGAGTISAVLVYALAKNTTGTSSIKIYDINPTTKAPNTMLGQSQSVNVANLVAGNLTPYPFATPVNFTSDFAASVVLPTGATDTLVVVSTKSNCYSNDSLSWELQSDDTWHSFETSWSSGGVGLKVDLVIFPVVQLIVGMTTITEDNLMSIYPNPANDVINIATVNDIVSVSVYNTMGQLIKSVKPSENILTFDVSDIQSGLYIMQVQTVNGMVARTVNIQ